MLIFAKSFHQDKKPPQLPSSDLKFGNRVSMLGRKFGQLDNYVPGQVILKSATCSSCRPTPMQKFSFSSYTSQLPGKEVKRSQGTNGYYILF